MSVIAEIMDKDYIHLFEQYGIQIYKIGARNAQTTSLIKAVAKTGKPILLKNGLGNDYQEFLSSADRIIAEDNDNIILCYRGTKPMSKDDKMTRNTMNIGLISGIKGETYLPLIADPSHGTGNRDLVESVSYALIAAGADGIMVDVHYDPTKARVDGKQAILPDEFARIVEKCRQIYEIVND